MRTIFAAVLTIAIFLGNSKEVSAEQVAVPGFLPYGFYQPYGVAYGNSVRTPPYFSTNPPVYYGGRYARPYGLSPFAAPPLLQPAANYRGKVSANATRVKLPESASQRAAISERAISVRLSDYRNRVANAEKGSGHVLGPVRSNPFASPKKVLVKQ